MGIFGIGDEDAPVAQDYSALGAAQMDANRLDQETSTATTTFEKKKKPLPTSKNYLGKEWATYLANPWETVQKTEAKGGLGDASKGLLEQSKMLGQGMDWGQFGKVQDGEGARNQAINAAYGQATSRLDPQWARREEAERTQLLNSGLDPSSEAYRGAMSEMGNQRNDAYSSAMNSAIGQGQAAGDSVFKNSMMGRQQSIAEALRKRSQPLDELNKINGLSGMPSYYQGNEMMQGALANDNFAMQKWSAENDKTAQEVGAAAGLVQSSASAAAVAASDERLKENVVRYDAEALPGVPFASWTWRGDSRGKREFGVIAQDLEKVAPELVVERHGFKHVIYAGLGIEQ
jgi:hypothetical protein